ncbi:DUF5313 family protein [Oerskovia enterophila]|uniref:DUF5313 family protein n=1 Tax=Oerskovia enterophila TaxID=43678 RepID=UPI0038277B82
MRRRDLTRHESFERSARFWARAYPRRWREVHGDELLAVQQDVALAVAEATGAPVPDRLSVDEVRGLLRAGWGLRWRERPPLWRWVLYRFGLRLPARYWWWVADDIRGAFYSVRDYVWTTVMSWGFIFGLFGVIDLFVDLPGTFRFLDTLFAAWQFWVFFAALALLSGTLMRKSRTRDAWYRHVVYGNVPEQMRPATVTTGGQTGSDQDRA